ncbi:hypothetical protein A2526_03075 [candidate division WOR-1 bacterium RIFOXYD2_FULL_36_8]|uniref:DUF5678 domain-containing protein n=1 Tax=candidate division WOR-1 bacterium RIFOXYB2_FULL_36_35 TaxID=1802578 RepID=A0A1F4S383_UNCSA|nr:MAG: hypothetical protein A2230_06495 [candidate division WOR-1 bacterium RIFOXYA2_FULL_36_21]OGC14906.1 MAG: hypothetical protein A2290_07395 [candidate division WOR-1 bacterium RIFOXYB2_FULL_36_35]OGC16735.1 MAG: hypothetical protein A2282_03950 [candidate division WOR-1 bacterium RIFOXYA12_FULL_36_13]OGC41092.1 MAG: hypothetical protein A2526_03075 [candidate division WOR-1 bacterium RIFOXYD2_FULL_36_8]
MDNLNPSTIAQKGEKIYQEKYKQLLEKSDFGQYVAIDIETETYYLGKTAEEALEKAKESNPQKIFHLIKIGSEGIFKVAWTLDNKLEDAWHF